jgi:serine protease
MRVRTRAALAFAAALAAVASFAASSAVAGPPGPGPVQPPPVYMPVYLPVPWGYAGVPVVGNMAYYHGAVLHRPHVYVDFWGWGHAHRAVADYLTAFFRGLGGSPYLGVTTQYYSTDASGNRSYVQNAAGQLAGVWFDRARPSHDNLLNGEIEQEALRAARHFGAAADHEAVFLVATPSYANSTGFNSGVYCGWHDFQDGIAFIDLPYVLNAGDNCYAHSVNSGMTGTLDGVSLVAGHEYVEAITDPGVGTSGEGTGWRDLDYQEIGDKCSYTRVGSGRPADIRLSTGTFAVQSIWSNEALEGVGNCAYRR